MGARDDIEIHFEYMPAVTAPDANKHVTIAITSFTSFILRLNGLYTNPAVGITIVFSFLIYLKFP